MKRLKSKRSAMASADRWFSRYIRLKYADDNGIVKCVTCHRMFHWKNIDCGHFRKKKKQPTRYKEENCMPQCKQCNRFKGGRDFLFGQAIDAKFGEGTAMDMHLLSKRYCHRKKFDFEALADYYKQKAKELAKGKGIEI